MNSYATRVFESVADLLAASREYIEKHGWCKGRYEDGYGRVCSVGSLPAAMGIKYYNFWDMATPEQRTQLRDAEQALLNALGTPNVPIPHWNDAPDRTKQDVLDLFAKAEKIERAGFDPDKGIVV